jgi:hypothetical protein
MNRQPNKSARIRQTAPLFGTVAIGIFPLPNLMASQKLTNCSNAAVGAFCLALHSSCFLVKASNLERKTISQGLESRIRKDLINWEKLLSGEDSAIPSC